jgi:hypothetical protein
MIFRKQIEDNDCFRTALGCLLNLEPQDVPHFVNLDGGLGGTWSAEGRMTVSEWLKDRNFEILEFGFHLGVDGTIVKLMENIVYLHGEDIVYLLMGLNRSHMAHVVICRGDKLLWDPSTIHSELPRPNNNVYWVTFISSAFLRYNGEMP